MCGKVRFAPWVIWGLGWGVRAGVMDNRSYAEPLLALGVIGLAVTCFTASSALKPASANQEAVSGAFQVAAVSRPPSHSPPTASTVVPAPIATAADQAQADASREAVCQAEFDKVVEEKPVVFPKDRWDLDAGAKAAVSKLAAVGKACSAFKIEIQAYTDNQGKRLNNTRLSANRADAVKEYLVELGLSPSLLTAVGFGPDHPVASNRTAKGRARNRRIAFRVTRVESE